jgi:hypothetical protein
MQQHRARGTSSADNNLATSSSHVVHPPLPYDLRGCGPFYNGGEHSRNVPLSGTVSYTIAIVDGQLRTVSQRTQHCHRTGCRQRPCAPSPPDKVLPSHPHPTVEGLSTPTNPLNLLVRATTRSGTLSLAPPSTAFSTPSLLPYTFGSKVCLSLEGVVAHPFCAGGLTPPPRKRT